MQNLARILKKMRKTYGNWQNVQPQVVRLKSQPAEELNPEEKYHKEMEGKPNPQEGEIHSFWTFQENNSNKKAHFNPCRLPEGCDPEERQRTQKGCQNQVH